MLLTFNLRKNCYEMRRVEYSDGHELDTDFRQKKNEKKENKPELRENISMRNERKRETTKLFFVLS